MLGERRVRRRANLPAMATVEGLFAPDGDGLGARLVAALNDPKWITLSAAVAFVKVSGLRYVAQPLATFCAGNPGGVAVTVGVDHGGSSIEAVADLHTILTQHASRLFIAQNPQGRPRPTFHPKMWLLADGGDDRLLLLGSGNLTKGGLHTNYEANVSITADAAEDVVIAAEAFLQNLRDPNQPEIVEATVEILQRLHDQGDLPSEAEARRVEVAANSLRRPHRRFPNAAPIFRGRAVDAPLAPAMPPLPPRPITIRTATSYAPANPAPPAPHGPVAVPGGAGVPVAAASVTPLHRYFFITIRMAQMTEVLLAKRPLDEDPAFFGAPFRGLTVPHGGGDPQPQADPPPLVRIELHTNPAVVVDQHELKLWTYTHGANANGDFRTNFTAGLQQQIADDSVVRIERDPVLRPDLQYLIDICPPGHPDYAAMSAKCTVALPNSPRLFGWE